MLKYALEFSSFLKLNDIPSRVHTTNVHPSVNGPLGYFLLAIVNSDAGSANVCVPLDGLYLLNI